CDSRRMVSCTPRLIDTLATSTKVPKMTPSVVRMERAFCCQRADSDRRSRSLKRTDAFLRKEASPQRQQGMSLARAAGCRVYFGENGCFAVSFFERISSIFGSFFMAFLIAILVAS